MQSSLLGLEINGIYEDVNIVHLICMLVADTSNTCSEINYHLHMVHQNNFLKCHCNLMHLLAIL